MTQKGKPLANPVIVLREEADTWALLFDPDTGKSFVLNPVGVFIWQCLNGRHTLKEIAEKLKTVCDDVPKDVEARVQEFIEDLMRIGMASYEFLL